MPGTQVHYRTVGVLEGPGWVTRHRAIVQAHVLRTKYGRYAGALQNQSLQRLQKSALKCEVRDHRDRSHGFLLQQACRNCRVCVSNLMRRRAGRGCKGLASGSSFANRWKEGRRRCESAVFASTCCKVLRAGGQLGRARVWPEPSHHRREGGQGRCEGLQCGVQRAACRTGQAWACPACSALRV